MNKEYEINQMAKEDSWRMFRIIGEFVEGFDSLADLVPAVTIYGSARTQPDDTIYKQSEEIAYLLGKDGFNIMTGGGPGVMEAANMGAHRAGVISAGINIQLPEEQKCNVYADRTITFHHFFVRKVMLVKYATAFIIMPGGLGTMDELTEVLNLIQTQKMKPFPVLLFSTKYWSGFIAWLKNTVLAQGNISPEDFDLLRVFDEPKEIADAVKTWYTKQQFSGRKALE
jgi:uncharacterized protein (TIGR00730 family)